MGVFRGSRLSYRTRGSHPESSGGGYKLRGSGLARQNGREAANEGGRRP